MCVCTYWYCKKFCISKTHNNIEKFLNFTDLPKLQNFHFPEIVKKGDKINILCSVIRGQSPFTFEWKKNSDVLQSKNNIQIIQNTDFSRLIINPVTDKSYGNYTCTVRSKYGSDSFSAFLHVKGEFMNVIINYLYK